MKKILILVGFLFLPQAFAAEGAVGLTLDLERQLSERVRGVVHSVDPTAQVFVRVKLKTQRVELPGTGAVVTGVLGAPALANLEPADFEQVRVKIVSKLNPFPESVKKAVVEDLGTSVSRVQVATEVMEPQIVELSTRQDQLRETAFKLEKAIESGGQRALFGFWIAIGLGFLFLAAQWVSGSRTRRQFEESMSKIVGQFGQSSPQISEIRRDAETSRAALPSSNRAELAGPSANEGLTGISSEGIIAILSDCYWCENDGYAAWMWRQLSSAQRLAALEGWGPVGDYAAYLSSKEGVPAGFHLHPYYLKPIDLKNVSQADLVSVVTQTRGAWHWISPMRQAALPMPLLEKVGLATDARATSVDFSKLKRSAPRALPIPIEFGTISIEEEERIFEEPQSVPEQIRSGIQSLVWLATDSPDRVKKHLEAFSAIELAEAWIGPEKVLNHLESLLPEKKRALLADYRKTVVPSRTSPSFTNLVKLSDEESMAA